MLNTSGRLTRPETDHLTERLDALAEARRALAIEPLSTWSW